MHCSLKNTYTVVYTYALFTHKHIHCHTHTYTFTSSTHTHVRSHTHIYCARTNKCTATYTEHRALTDVRIVIYNSRTYTLPKTCRYTYISLGPPLESSWGFIFRVNPHQLASRKRKRCLRRRSQSTAHTAAAPCLSCKQRQSADSNQQQEAVMLRNLNPNARPLKPIAPAAVRW